MQVSTPILVHAEVEHHPDGHQENAVTGRQAENGTQEASNGSCSTASFCIALPFSHCFFTAVKVDLEYNNMTSFHMTEKDGIS